MLRSDQINFLKIKILSEDKRQGNDAVNALIKLDKEFALCYLITLLSHPNPIIFNRAALGLHDIGDNRALEPLLTAIHKPENANKNGTLAYALQALDCSVKLLEIFDLLFYGDYEVKISAANILDGQKFNINKADLIEIQNKWNNIQAHPERCPDFNISKKDIDEFVNLYISYL